MADSVSFNIPPSTYYKLKNDRHSIELAIKKARLNGVSDDSEMTDEEKKYLKKLVTPPRPPPTIKLINENLSNVFGQRDRARKIRQLMKSDMRYSFKKGSSRPFKVLSPKSDIMNGIYWWKLLSLICRDALIINIDESSFSRSVKSNYSWFPRGKGSSIIHNTILGRCSLILGIWIDGKIIGSITIQTLKRENFHYFLGGWEGLLLQSASFIIDRFGCWWTTPPYIPWIPLLLNEEVSALDYCLSLRTHPNPLSLRMHLVQLKVTSDHLADLMQSITTNRVESNGYSEQSGVWVRSPSVACGEI